MVLLLAVLLSSLTSHQVALHRDYVLCKESETLACKELVKEVEAIHAPKNKLDK